jgi:hypothetical protein
MEVIVHTDKEGWVDSVEREPSERMIDSVMREVQRADMPALKTQICKGPWHYRGGKGTPLPIDQFPMNRYRKGERTKTCGECLEKSGKRNAVSERDMMQQREVTVSDIVNHGVAGAVHKWRVTVLKPTEEIVYASSYADIPAEIGAGDILKVERLD